MDTKKNNSKAIITCVRKILSTTSQASVVFIAKPVVQKQALKQVMKLVFVNLAKKNLVNLDVDVNERRVPLNQKSKLNHESISTSTWKLGNLDVNFFDWTPP
jgi:hypothetical protein